MPTAGMMPQPVQSQMMSQHVERTGGITRHIQKTQQTSTKSVSVRSQASHALRTPVGRAIVGQSKQVLSTASRYGDYGSRR